MKRKSPSLEELTSGNLQEHDRMLAEKPAIPARQIIQDLQDRNMVLQGHNLQLLDTVRELISVVKTMRPFNSGRPVWVEKKSVRGLEQAEECLRTLSNSRNENRIPVH